MEFVNLFLILFGFAIDIIDIYFRNSELRLLVKLIISPLHPKL